MALPPTAVERLDRWRVRLRPVLPYMRVEGRVYADGRLFRAIERDGTLRQVAHVAALPGIVGASIAMPDAHQGYGFPIGGVAATDVDAGGVISPGGVGFDINCGVRLLAADVPAREVGEERLSALADALAGAVPAGLGRTRGRRAVLASEREVRRVLARGARAVVEAGMGWAEDLEACEDGGCHPDADPDRVGHRAIERGTGQLGTLGSGNHFVEVQRVERVHDAAVAEAFGLFQGQLVVLVHTGSRGLGHQVCSDHVRALRAHDRRHAVALPDAQLACAPVASREGAAYLGVMAAAANFAWANRQVLTHRLRRVFREVLGAGVRLRVVYDVAHNIARIEEHVVDGRRRRLCVHRKGATRCFPAGRAELPARFRETGHPVFVPGSMGTASYVLVGGRRALAESFGSTCHGAGRVMSRTAARRAVTPPEVERELAARGVLLRAASRRGAVEEFPGAYKDVEQVVHVVEGAGLARRVARLVPLAVVKG